MCVCMCVFFFYGRSWDSTHVMCSLRPWSDACSLRGLVSSGFASRASGLRGALGFRVKELIEILEATQAKGLE